MYKRILFYRKQAASVIQRGHSKPVYRCSRIAFAFTRARLTTNKNSTYVTSHMYMYTKLYLRNNSSRIIVYFFFRGKKATNNQIVIFREIIDIFFYGLLSRALIIG